MTPAFLYDGTTGIRHPVELELDGRVRVEAQPRPERGEEADDHAPEGDRANLALLVLREERHEGGHREGEEDDQVEDAGVED